MFPIIPGEGRLFLVWASTGWLRSWEIDDDEYFDKHDDDEYEKDDFAAKDCFSTWMKPPGIRAPRGTSPGTRRGSGFWKRFWSGGLGWWSWWLGWWSSRSMNYQEMNHGWSSKANWIIEFTKKSRMIFIIHRCQKAPDCVIRLPLVVKVCELLKRDSSCNSSSIFHRGL